MSSAAKSGALSIPKPVSPATPVAASPSVSPTGSHLSYRALNASEVANNAFFSIGLEMSAEQAIFFYAVQKAARCEVASPITERAFVSPSDGVVYFEAACGVERDSKESLASLLDMADDAGCSRVCALVPKDGGADVKQIVSSFGACGFAVSRGSQPRGHVLLQFDLN